MKLAQVCDAIDKKRQGWSLFHNIPYYCKVLIYWGSLEELLEAKEKIRTIAQESFYFSELNCINKSTELYVLTVGFSDTQDAMMVRLTL